MIYALELCFEIFRIFLAYVIIFLYLCETILIKNKNMKKLILILLCIFSLNLYSINLEITVNTPGTLSKILGDDEDYLTSIVSLKINGNINEEDFKIINTITSKHPIILYKCSSLDLSDVNIPNNIFKYEYLRGGLLGSIIFPKTLKKIENNCFDYRENIRYVTFFEGLEYIGCSCFAWSNLSIVDLPSTLTTLGDRAFTHCSITKINCKSINPPNIIYQYALKGGYHNDDPSTYTIADSIPTGAWGGGYSATDWKTPVAGHNPPCEIHCPIGSKTKYRNNSWFGQFSYIIQDLNVISNTTNIQTNLYKILNKQIISDKDLIVYNINGIQINWKNKVLNSGLYIIKHEDNIIKIKI